MYNYGKEYQLIQAEKYRNRFNNHWKTRIGLAFDLVDQYVCIPNTDNFEITVADIGCSIGTFAIEFAKKGYNTFGIDFDKEALKIAEQLANEERINTSFLCGDIADKSLNIPAIDIAICFDIFEHLHDDELGSLLSSIRARLKNNGSIVFHTCPTKYDYIFRGPSFLRYPLELFNLLPNSVFKRIIKIYSYLIDIVLLLKKGKTYSEMIEKSAHCNPTTKEQLEKIFRRAGYEIVHIETSTLYEHEPPIFMRFAKHPESHRNIFGVAVSMLKHE
ncbi:MAG: methyltransferase domain-containing protein [bacterium]